MKKNITYIAIALSFLSATYSHAEAKKKLAEPPQYFQKPHLLESKVSVEELKKQFIAADDKLKKAQNAYAAEVRDLQSKNYRDTDQIPKERKKKYDRLEKKYLKAEVKHQTLGKQIIALSKFARPVRLAVVAGSIIAFNASAAEIFSTSDSEVCANRNVNCQQSEAKRTHAAYEAQSSPGDLMLQKAH